MAGDDVGGEELVVRSDFSVDTSATNTPQQVADLAGKATKVACRFDGLGNYWEEEVKKEDKKDWDLKDWNQKESKGEEFRWYHLELPKGDHELTLSAQMLICAVCPPLNLHEVLTLASNGPYCGDVNGALFFRVNSPGPADNSYTLRLAVRVTEKCIITASLGKVRRLRFSSPKKLVLKDIPKLTHPGLVIDGETDASGYTVIMEHVLEDWLKRNHTEFLTKPVPMTMSNLVVHIIDTHVDHIQDIVTGLEMELQAVELDLDKGCAGLKEDILNERKLPRMQLNLQRLLQVVSYGVQVFPRVKENCAMKSWFANEDILLLEEVISRLRRIKENLGFIANRMTAIQAGLDSWQSEKINRKLYYLSVLSLIFLPLSVVTGIFGMNVGGVPWTGQRDPALKDGFENVIIICVLLVALLLCGFVLQFIHERVYSMRAKHALKRSRSPTQKSTRSPARSSFVSSLFRREFRRGHRVRDYLPI